MTKKHTRRRVDPTAWAAAIANSQPTPPEDALRITNEIRIAFERLKSGSGDNDDFQRLAAAINIGIIRAEQIAPEVVAVMTAACEAMLECARRFTSHGRFGFADPELVTIDHAIEWYSQILRLSTPLQMERAVEETARRIRGGLGHMPAHQKNEHVSAGQEGRSQ